MYHQLWSCWKFWGIIMRRVRAMTNSCKGPAWRWNRIAKITSYWANCFLGILQVLVWWPPQMKITGNGVLSNVHILSVLRVPWFNWGYLWNLVLHWPTGIVRLYLPRRLLSVSNTGSFGRDDYCELSSRFKAQHVKTTVWWIAKKVMEITQDSDTQHKLNH